jgi:diacylglycerol kinase family enzyme
MATTAPGSATHQAAEAACNGAEIIFACGGDGTVHEALQGLVSEVGKPTAALGIIPLGSANALARHLRLSFDPCEAALAQISGAPHTIPVGKVVYGDQLRYFSVMAGAGPDGALVYNNIATHKSRLGRFAYYLHAARLFVTSRFHPFEVEYSEAGSGRTVFQAAIGVMAVRVDDLGGLFSKLTESRASIHDPFLRLMILHPPALFSLPLWFVSSWFNLRRPNRFLSNLEAITFSCRSTSGLAVHAQADGEWLGRIPIQVSLVPNALRIHLPRRKTPL